MEGPIVRCLCTPLLQIGTLLGRVHMENFRQFPASEMT
jgi:hypothetical protein